MIDLDGSSLTLDALGPHRARRRAGAGCRPTPRARARVSCGGRSARGRAARAVYGINTGFGALADVAIPARSAVGPPAQPAAQPRRRRRRAAADVPVVRALHGAARERAGEGLLRHPPGDARRARGAVQRGRAPARARPRVRSAPAATWRRSRIWRSCRRRRGRRRDRRCGAAHRVRPAADALARAGLRRSRSRRRKGIALINGTQASTAVLALAVLGDRRGSSRAADIAAAMSIDALRGSIHPFEARHPRRPARSRPGRVGRQSVALVEGSAINASHARLRQGAGRLRAALRAAGARLGARGARLRAPAGRRSR